MSLHADLMMLSQDLREMGRRADSNMVIEACKRLAMLDDLAERARQIGECARKVPRDD